MGNSTLAQIRARLAAAEQNKNSFQDNTFFPFWNAKTDTTSVLRFCADGDPSNDYFWVEKLQIKLPFNGIKGGDTKPVLVAVPCVEMWGKAEFPQGCPILSEVRVWYKDDSLKERAGKYWKKPTYIMQGFVRDNAVPDDKAPENPIRKFALNKQIFNLVKAGLMDPDMENLPCDYDHGTDFRIVKTQKGQYADYGTSNYARKESSLTPIEREAIEKYGLVKLSDYLGKKPSEDDLKIIRAMFEASVDGEAYDAEKWGNHYKPAGFKSEKDGESTGDNGDSTNEEASTKSVPAASKKAETKKKDEDTEAAADGKSSSAADILAMIKARGRKGETK